MRQTTRETGMMAPRAPWGCTVVQVVTCLALAGVGAARPAAGTSLDPHPGLTFQAKRGAGDDLVRFEAHGRGYTVSIESAEAVLALGAEGRPGGAVVRLRPAGANPAPRIVADGEPAGASRSRRVRYADVYPGVDLVYHGRSGRLEYDFVVAAGADPGQIALILDGAEEVEVDAAGDLVAHTPAGDLRQPRPVVYQEVGDARLLVAGDYQVDDQGRVRFRLGAYDASRPLVIDPVLAYSTYLGGSSDDADEFFDGIVGIAVDGSGNVYVAGTTHSADFPTTPGADRALDGDTDLFVTKFSPAGTILYSTYLGGPCEDAARDIAVDPAGNAYVTGRVHGGVCFADVQPGVLVAKLDPAGALVYASVLGGRLADSSIGQAIAVDAAGHAYVTGVANTSSRDFPTTPGAFRTAECDDVYWFGGDGFVAKLSADGSSLDYSTILCGSGDDSPAAIAVDAAGSAYVAGTTASSDFPTVDPVQASRRGGPVGVTGFVSKLSPDGSRLVYSTYLGGSESEAVGGIAVDGQGNAYVTGETNSDDFPTTPGVLQEHAGARLCLETCTDAFVTKIDRSGSAIVYSTYLFGELDDAGSRIAVDGAGNAYVVGTTVSGAFPILDAFQTANRGVPDAFVAKLNPDGTRLLYSSYLGGSRSGSSPRTGWDQGTAIAVDAAGVAYVAGYTQSLDFPTTPGAAAVHLGGGTCDVFGTPCGDAFIAKISAGGPGVVPAISVRATPAEVSPGGTLVATWAGIPTPGASDELRLHPLGGSNDALGEVAGWWVIGDGASGTVSLQVPDGLAAGWYELRLLSPGPDSSSLLTVVARSEPIRVAGAAATSTTTTLPDVTTTTLSGAVTTTTLPGALTCAGADDASGLGCLCDHDLGPTACPGETLPPRIRRAVGQACRGAARGLSAATERKGRRLLARAATSFARALHTVGRPRVARSLSPSCKTAVVASLGDAQARARRLAH
jgi:hypothetical protein